MGLVWGEVSEEVHTVVYDYVHMCLCVHTGFLGGKEEQYFLATPSRCLILYLAFINCLLLGQGMSDGCFPQLRNMALLEVVAECSKAVV